MAVGPVSATSASQSAFGLDFQSLLRIVLTQLTYQDPLKPLDNFQFVSQLAQFSQLQQTQSLSDQLTSLISAQGAAQATSLLGRTVDIATETQSVTGTVKAISFVTGQPEITINTADGQTISNVSLSNVTQVR